MKQLVITASIASLVASADFWKEITITEKCESCKTTTKKGGSILRADLYNRYPPAYNPQTVEDALQPGASDFLVYAISKGLADRAVRDFKRAHPDLDVTTIHPSYVYGPLGSGQVYDTLTTGSNHHIYELIAGAPDRPVDGYDPAIRAPPLHVDVRDVARAHVLALKVPPLADEPKRFILSSSRFTWKEAIEFIAQARPELKGRLPVVTGKEPPVPPFAILDTSETENILGFKDYYKWQDTVLDTIHDMLRVEKELAAAAQ